MDGNFKTMSCGQKLVNSLFLIYYGGEVAAILGDQHSACCKRISKYSFEL